MYELQDPRGYEAMTLREYTDTYPLWCVPQPVWFNRVVDLTKPFLSFLNVRYAVVWGTFSVPQGWRVFATQRGCKLLENEHVIERAFVPKRVTVGEAERKTFQQMMTETDFHDRAWISATQTPYERENGPGRVTVREHPRAYEISAAMQRDGWIVISESAWKGWRAYLDGRRVKIQRANIAFLSVYVPAGDHHVRLAYLPQSFVAGRAISLLTLGAIVTFAITRRVLRSRRPRLQGT
jgi:hypothetical protein